MTENEDTADSYEDPAEMSEEELLQVISAHDAVELKDGRELIIDSEMGLEKLWTWGGVFALLGLLIAFVLWLEESDHTRVVAMWSGLSFLGFFILGLLTDNHYIIDLNDRKLSYHGSFLGFKRVQAVCHLSDLAGLVVKGIREDGRYGTRWEYALVLFTREGKELQITDSSSDFGSANFLGECLSHLFRVPFFEATEEMVTVIEYDDATMQLDTHFADRHPPTKANILLYVVVGIVLIGALFFVVGSFDQKPKGPVMMKDATFPSKR